MRLRDFLIATTLMSLTLNSGLAKPLPPAPIDRTDCSGDLPRPIEPPRSAVPLPARSVLPLPPAPALISEDKVLKSVYYNTLAILSTNNSCSDFFGGPTASMEVFSRFMGQVRKDYVAPSIAMRMHGSTTNAQDARTNTRYRLFEKVSINANGPFYKRSVFRYDRTVLGVGSFGANTPEVRVLILLHELGHLMQDHDGSWLLPDDGGNEQLSRNNSHKIEKVCGDQINDINDGEALRILAMRNQPDEKLALDSNNPEPSPIERTGNH